MKLATKEQVNLGHKLYLVSAILPKWRGLQTRSVILSSSFNVQTIRLSAQDISPPGYLAEDELTALIVWMPSTDCSTDFLCLLILCFS